MSVLDSLENGFGRVNSAVFKQVNRAREWWQLPTPLGLLNLRAYRDDLRHWNLYDTRAPVDADGGPATREDLPKHRTYDGSRQDPTDPEMGMVGSRFGRNTPPEATAPETMPRLMAPSPREVSTRLLNRDTFKPATTLNVLAACWIQFEDHDWFGHGENMPDEFVDVPLDEGDAWPEGSPMKIKRTSPDRTRSNRSGLPPTTSTPSPTGGTAPRSTAPARSETASCGRARAERWRSRMDGFRTRARQSLTAST